MKNIILVPFLFLTIVSKAQCILPYLHKTKEDTEARIQIHNILNIPQRNVIKIKSKSELSSLVSQFQLKDLHCNLDSLDTSIKKSIDFYIGTQQKRDSLREKIKLIDAYFEKTLTFFDNREKANVDLVNKNETQIINLLKKHKKEKYIPTKSINEIKDRMNMEKGEIDNAISNVFMTKLQMRKFKEANDLCQFLKYDITLVEMYRAYFKKLHQGISSNSYPLILSLAYHYAEQKVPVILKNNGINIDSNTLKKTFSVEKKRVSFDNWRAATYRNHIQIVDSNNQKNTISILLLENQKGIPNYLISIGKINTVENFLAWKINNDVLTRIDFKNLFSLNDQDKYTNQKYVTSLDLNLVQLRFELHERKIINHKFIDEYRFFWNGNTFTLCTYE